MSWVDEEWRGAQLLRLKVASLPEDASLPCFLCRGATHPMCECVATPGSMTRDQVLAEIDCLVEILCK